VLVGGGYGLFVHVEIGLGKFTSPLDFRLNNTNVFDWIARELTGKHFTCTLLQVSREELFAA